MKWKRRNGREERKVRTSIKAQAKYELLTKKFSVNIRNKRNYFIRLQLKPLMQCVMKKFGSSAN